MENTVSFLSINSIGNNTLPKLQTANTKHKYKFHRRTIKGLCVLIIRFSDTKNWEMIWWVNILGHESSPQAMEDIA